MTLTRMTFSITKASTTTLSIADLIGTLNIIEIQHKGRVSLCRVSHFYIGMLTLVMLSVIMLSVVMLSDVMLSVVASQSWTSISYKIEQRQELQNFLPR